jgi:hypothetical protein
VPWAKYAANNTSSNEPQVSHLALFGHKYRGPEVEFCPTVILSYLGYSWPRIFAMRLINTLTLELSDFYDFEIPKYAILSHTWGKEEVSFQQWCSPDFPCNAGYWKIYHFCSTCRRDGYEWAWVDTCCIDKTSSAEL